MLLSDMIRTSELRRDFRRWSVERSASIVDAIARELAERELAERELTDCERIENCLESGDCDSESQ